MNEIYEDQQYSQEFQELRESLMSKEDIKRVDFYLSKYNLLKGDMENRETEWTELQGMYEGEVAVEDETKPNAYVNIILPAIEGQVASMTEQNITANFKAKGASDHPFCRTANIAMDTVFAENQIRQRVKKLGRRYLLFGNGWLSLAWNPDALDGLGLPEIRVPQLSKVFIDGNIKNMEDVQKADYIIEEVGYKSITWAREEYGDEFADALQLANNEIDMEAEESEDDKDSFTLFYVWTRNNKQKNLQRLEISKCGLLLRESDPKDPYYKYVNNKYPYFPCGQYPIEGQFYRFGDGKLLKPMQKLLNQLYDEVVTAIKFSAQSRTFIDPRSEVNPDEFDSDPSHPIMAKNPREYIYDQKGAGINEIVFQLIQHAFIKVQEMIRFSNLMTGNQPTMGITATQANIQAQSGNTGINDKRNDISLCLGECANYCLGMLMENWTTGQALRVTDNEDEFEWVDVRQMTEAPVMTPADSNYIEAYKTNYPEEEPPKLMQLKDEDGVPQTKVVALDSQVSIGEGLPTNKIALFNMLMQLGQIMLPDEMGQMTPLINRPQFIKYANDYLGLNLEETPSNMPLMNPMMMGGVAGTTPLNMDANVPNLNMAGTSTGGMGIG